jgi:cyclic beta-1,2-glucan synthetase
MTDAILRTLFRLFISHRKMLEWTLAAHSKIRSDDKLAFFYKRMAVAPLFAVMTTLMLFACHTPDRLWIMAPFVMLWAFSPWIAQRVSLPIKTSETRGTLIP